ncbi:MFS transporter [Cohnella xylanilytica]|uniref:MFS transporter n=1 Tax=Cohnella xylanilytica TaxID=557555 RepID=UPI002892EC49|nr:MFS transporter [Cohnella xylanilytica]
MLDERKAVRSWILYDWANSAFATTVMAAVMPTFYGSVAAVGLAEGRASAYWGFTQTTAAIVVALLSPLLGAIADHTGGKKKFLAFFTWLGALASCGMFAIGEGDWLLASVLVVIGMVGFGAGNTFYDALLNDVASPSRRERVSARGFAAGYLGGGVLLAVNLALILAPGTFGIPDKTMATRISFFSVGLWWLLFSLPLFRNVKEPKPHAAKAEPAARLFMTGVRRLRDTLAGIKRYPELFKFMVAYWFFFDGINTIIVMATSYGTDIGLEQQHLIAALLLTQIVGFPATWLFGKLADRLGGFKMLYAALTVYLVIVVLGYFMTNAAHFYALAILVGLVQGGAQSTSRAIYSKLIPPDRTAEFNGFLSFSSRFFSLAGPLAFAVVGLATGSSRPAILAISAFFFIGIALLATVNYKKGCEEAATRS